ncbi:MAG: xanthine dehydrogenase family protein [Solirubrobacteraceae bacterium]
MAVTGLSRVEDQRLITGAGDFVADLRLPRMVEMALLRSDVPHGRLVSLDCEQARSSPGVLAAIGARDLTGVSPFPDFIEAMRPVATFPLAVDRVRYVGAPVAAVVAENRARAEDALETVTAEYEPLEAVATLERALADDAPRLFDGWADNRAVDVTRRDPEVARILASSRVVRASYRVHRQAPAPMETRGSVAAFAAGRLTLWTGNQSPHIVRTTLATVLGISEHAIRVVVDDVGGSFGSKTHVYPEDVLVAWLAMRLGRPVRWIEDRAEHFVASVHARDQRHVLEAAIDDDGRILAVRAQITCDIGSGEVFPAGVASSFVTGGVLTGPYRIPHAEVGVTCVVTNKTPSGAYRGFGTPEAVFAMERLVERIASETGRDAIELRREMLLERDALPYAMPSGSIIDSGSHRDCFDRAVGLGRAALAQARAQRRRRRRRGWGAASPAIWRASAPLTSSPPDTGPRTRRARSGSSPTAAWSSRSG